MNEIYIYKTIIAFFPNFLESLFLHVLFNLLMGLICILLFKIFSLKKNEFMGYLRYILLLVVICLVLYLLKDSKILFEFEHIFKSIIFFVNEIFYSKEDEYLAFFMGCVAIIYGYSCWPQKEDPEKDKIKKKNEKKENSKISDEESKIESVILITIGIIGIVVSIFFK